MRSAITLCLAFAMGAALVYAAPKIQVWKEPAFDFAALKTWAWNPAGPGDIKVWVRAESESEPVKKQYGPVFMDAIASELTRRGFTKAAEGAAPDFHLACWVFVTVGNSSQQMGGFLPAVTEWALPPFSAQTTAIKFYPMGTVVLDVASADPKRVVWRGTTQAEIDMDKTDEQRTARIQSVVRDMLGKLPRKK
jgi:hypothetical protein